MKIFKVEIRCGSAYLCLIWDGLYTTGNVALIQIQVELPAINVNKDFGNIIQKIVCVVLDSYCVEDGDNVFETVHVDLDPYYVVDSANIFDVLESVKFESHQLVNH